MLSDVVILDLELVKSIKWTGNSKSYDLDLYALGPTDEGFIVRNPWVSDSKPFYFIDSIPKTKKCVVWKYKGEWVAKFFPPNWKRGYLSVEIQIPAFKWIKNPSLGKAVQFDDTVFKTYWPDPWETKHELVWYLDPKSNPLKEKIWAFKCTVLGHEKIGIMDMGYVTPKLPDRFDVIFISYEEPNAEENWRRVLKKAPWAKRIHGVKGIFQAHKMAAQISSTEMFYVVDGDAWLVDSWEFDYKPELFERDCTYIWHSVNPFSNHRYGYGGVKLFSRYRLLKSKKWTTLDMSTTIDKNVKVFNRVSVVTNFNSDPFNTWKSAFREAVKLSNNKNKIFLDLWVNKKEVRFSEYAELGLEQGIKFFEMNKNKKSLFFINDIDWLKQTFNDLNGKKYLLNDSKTFCMAPWVHINKNPAGKVYPCCIASHPVAKSPEGGLDKIINSASMKELRVNMLKGKHSSTCETCYKHDSQGIGAFRQTFNNNFGHHFNEVIANTKFDGTLKNFKMRYFDLRFSNICNFKCRTCNYEYSSQWEHEDKRRGIQRPIINFAKEDTALLQDVIDQIPNIETAYFAGGEPLITEEHYILLDEMIRQNRTDISLQYNSNLSLLRYKDKDLLDLWSYFEKPIHFQASIDHYGDRAEYIRHGTDWATVETNLKKLHQLENINLSINTVVSAFNYATLAEFYNYMIKLEIVNHDSLPFTAYNMTHPPFLTSHILPAIIKEKASKSIIGLSARLEKQGYSQRKTSELRNTVKWAESQNSWDKHQKEFLSEIENLDQIRNQDFAKTFPELAKLLK